MLSYTCERCLKVFKKKCDIVRHIKHRKKPCGFNNIIMAPDLQFVENGAINSSFAENKAPDLHFVEKNIKNINNTNDMTSNNEDNEDKNKCEYCNKKFVKRYGLNRHLLRCKIKLNISIQLKKEVDILKNENDQLKIEQKAKEEEFDKLRIENEKLNHTIINNTSIINNGTINNNNININIVNYREEDFSKLDLKKILQYDNSFIEMVFRDIHCNSEFPENQNILLPSLTRYDIYVKFNNEWLKRNKKEILTERYTTIREHLMDLYDKEKEINKKKADNDYFHFLKQIKLVDPSNSIYKPDEEKKIIEGMANVLYNHKNNIKSKIKTPLIKKIKKI
jgi:hypothetical protein